MDKGLYIDARQLTKGAKAFDQLVKQFPDRISDVLNANADDIVTAAKRAAPSDRSDLRKGIFFTNTNPLQKHITSRAPYSAYIEFGTGRYAAQYIGSLPNNYQAFAAQFRRGKMPKIKALLFILMEWFERVGVKDRSHRYFIARNIFINGVHPHPFMIPALINQMPKIIRNIKTLLDNLKI